MTKISPHQEVFHKEPRSGPHKVQQNGSLFGRLISLVFGGWISNLVHSLFTSKKPSDISSLEGRVSASYPDLEKHSKLEGFVNYAPSAPDFEEEGPGSSRLGGSDTSSEFNADLELTEDFVVVDFQALQAEDRQAELTKLKSEMGTKSSLKWSDLIGYAKQLEGSEAIKSLEKIAPLLTNLTELDLSGMILDGDVLQLLRSLPDTFFAQVTSLNFSKVFVDKSTTNGVEDFFAKPLQSKSNKNTPLFPNLKSINLFNINMPDEDLKLINRHIPFLKKGEGTYIAKDLFSYSGSWANFKFEGRGILKTGNQEFIGSFKDSVLTGKVICHVLAHKEKWIVECRDGKVDYTKKVTILKDNGDRFTGSLDMLGNMSGQVITTLQLGVTYRGEVLNGLIHGQGELEVGYEGKYSCEWQLGGVTGLVKRTNRFGDVSIEANLTYHNASFEPARTIQRVASLLKLPGLREYRVLD